MLLWHPGTTRRASDGLITSSPSLYCHRYTTRQAPSWPWAPGLAPAYPWVAGFSFLNAADLLQQANIILSGRKQRAPYPLVTTTKPASHYCSHCSQVPWVALHGLWHLLPLLGCQFATQTLLSASSVQSWVSSVQWPYNPRAGTPPSPIGRRSGAQNNGPPDHPRPHGAPSQPSLRCHLLPRPSSASSHLCRNHSWPNAAAGSTAAPRALHWRKSWPRIWSGHSMKWGPEGLSDSLSDLHSLRWVPHIRTPRAPAPHPFPRLTTRRSRGPSLCSLNSFNSLIPGSLLAPLYPECCSPGYSHDSWQQ